MVRSCLEKYTDNMVMPPKEVGIHNSEIYTEIVHFIKDHERYTEYDHLFPFNYRWGCPLFLLKVVQRNSLKMEHSHSTNVFVFSNHFQYSLRQVFVPLIFMVYVQLFHYHATKCNLKDNQMFYFISYSNMAKVPLENCTIYCHPPLIKPCKACSIHHSCMRSWS